MKILPIDKEACTTYIQGNAICEKCLRNIGFYSKEHFLWNKFKFNHKNNSCDHFLEKGK